MVTDPRLSQLQLDPKFSRVTRFKVAFKHGKVCQVRTKLNSLKNEFDFKISVLNLARHEKKRKVERSRSKEKAEIDRLGFEK